MNKRELVGLTFNRLTVIEEIEPTYTPSGRKVFKYKCQCSCGNTTKVSGWTLTNQGGGKTKSCGCLKVEDGLRKAKLMQKVNTKYTGKEKILRTKARWARAHLVARCYDPNSDMYPAYGAKGITVCDRWRYGEDGKKPIECFIEDVGYPPSINHSIDRIDPTKNYEPNNVRWLATMKEQQRNRTNNNLVTYNGETKCIAEWAEELGMNYGTLHNRLTKLGWSVADAFSKPVRTRAA